MTFPIRQTCTNLTILSIIGTTVLYALLMTVRLELKGLTIVVFDV